MNSKSSRKSTSDNQKAWNTGRYDAWVSAFGTPDAQARHIVSDPLHPVRRITPYLGAIDRTRICSVQGSHGRVAVALARLGAKVDVIDFSEENRRYAMQLAEAANVSIRYNVCDVMDAASLDLPYRFEALVLELGILHYHQDIDRFFAVMRQLVADGGLLLLNEFHPIQRKLYWEEGPKNYFCKTLVEADVPNPDKSGPSLGLCQYRFWTIGEILNALIRNDFTIKGFDEHPDMNTPEIPGTFTLRAQA